MAISLPRALAFALTDPQGIRKVLIGTAISAVPVLNFFAVAGYATTVARNVQSGVDDSEVLPEWSEFGELLFKGLMAGGIVLCYAAVFGLLNMLVAIPTGMATIALGLPIPGWLLLGVLRVLFFVAGSVLGLAALSLYAETGEFRSAFSPGDLFVRLASAPRDWALLVVAWSGGAILIGVATSFVPYVGPLLTGALMFPLTLVAFHAMGQLLAEVSPPVVLARRPIDADTGGSRPASAFADGKHETVLTWSTDSDRPDQD